MYELHKLGVKRLSDGAVIPANPDLPAWRAYQQWLEDGNAPQPMETLDDAKARQLGELQSSYEAAMSGGFVSSAVGAPYRYPSDDKAQIRLAGAAASDDSVYFECINEATGETVLQLHDATQMKNVLRDAKNQAVTYKVKLNALMNQVREAVSIGDVNSIKW